MRPVSIVGSGARIVTVCIVLAPSAAVAKGGTGPAQPAPSGRLAPQAASQIGVRQCPAPARSDCESLSYALSPCGEQESRRATGRVGFGACFERCAEVTPTIAQCQDEAWLNSICGRLERQRMDLEPVASGVHPSVCFQLLSTLGDAVFMGTASATAMVPPEVDCDGCVTPNNTPLSLTPARRLDDDRSDYAIEPPTSNYYGRLAEDFTHLSKAPGSDPHQNRFTMQRQTWASNGPTVLSCAEYVYEKYYNFNAYLDRAAAVAPDHRAMFDIAYALDRNGGPEPWAIGERGVLGLPVQHFDSAVATTPQVELPSELQGRNVFFDAVYMLDAERADFREQFDAGELQTSRPVGYGIFLFDDDLQQRMRAGAQTRNRVVKSFAYHKMMGAALTPSLIEPQFRLYEGARRRFADLVRRHQLIWIAYFEWLTQFTDDVDQAIPEVQVFFDPAGNLIDPAPFIGSPVAKVLDGAREFKSQRRQAHGLRTSTTNQRPQLILPARRPAAFSAQFSAAGPGGLSGHPGFSPLVQQTIDETLTSLTPYESCNTWVCFLEAIAQTEALIEEALVAARDLGCLDVGSPPHPCDWSPLDFVEALGDPYETVREPEFRACVEKTPGETPFARLQQADFSYGNGQVPSWEGQPCVAGDYTVSIPMVERYFDCRVEWVKAVLLELQSQLDEPDLFEPGPPAQLVVGKQDSDHNRVGNDMFGAQLDYDIGWTLPGTSLPAPGTGDYCGLQPSARASMSARGRALFLEKQLVEASAEVSLAPGEPSSAFLEVAGQEIFHPDPVQFSAAAFNPVLEAQEDLSEDIVKASATITVVFIPVKIAGGIAGRISAGASVAAGAQKGSSCANGDLGLVAEFAPATALDAFASASIDAVIVEAGVQITLTIISLELPLSTSLRFDGVGAGATQDSRLTANASLDFVLRMLSGRVSAFVEVCYIIDCERAEATLFSWGGPTLTENIFDVAFEVPVEAMSILQDDL